MTRVLILLLGLTAACLAQENLQLQVTVVSEDKKPVSGAEVWIWDAYLGTPIFSGQTSAEGRVKAPAPLLPRVNLANYEVLALTKDHAAVGTLYADMPKAGQELAAIMTLLPAASTERVRVLDPQGRPAAGLKLRVDAFRSLSSRRFFLNVPELTGHWAAATDAEGRAVISGLPAESAFHFRHDHPGFAEFKGRNHLKPSGGEEVTLRLEPGAVITGRLILPDGAPVGGADVRLYEMPPYEAEHSASTQTGPDGVFRLERVPFSRYRVAADPGFCPEGEKWTGPSATEVDARQPGEIALGDLKARLASFVTLKFADGVTGKELLEPMVVPSPPGEHTFRFRSLQTCPPGYGVPADLRLTLQEGERITAEFKLPPVAGFSGTVRDDEGNPVKDAGVFGTFPNLSHGPPMHATTDELGRYTITPPKEGVEGHWVILYAAKVDSSAASNLLNVRAAPSGGHDLVMGSKNLGRVTGAVLDESGQPVQGAEVSWSASEIPVYTMFVPRVTLTDAAGRFEMESVWPDIELMILAAKDGYAQRRRATLIAKKGQATPVQITLAVPKESVEGVVLRADGSPAAGIPVRSSGEGQPSVEAISAANGEFRLQGLFAGKVHVRAAERTDASSTHAGQWVEVGKTGRVELNLPVADGEIGGVILNPSGQPVANAELRLFSRDREGRTDARGRFKIGGIMPGCTTLTIYPHGADTEEGREDARIKTGQLEERIVLSGATRLPPIPLEEPEGQGALAKPVRPVKWFNSTPYQPEKPPGVIRILDFWGTACAPCLASFPKVDQFWKEVSPGGKVELIAITGDTNPLEVEELIAEKKYTFPVGIMAKDDPFAVDYAIRGIPLYVVIDVENRIVYRGHEWALAERKARELLE